MKGALITLGVIAGIIVLGLIAAPYYSVNEGEQAVVTRFGKVVAAQSSAGLKTKLPFVDHVVKYPKMILSWDGEAQRIPTLENQFIWVDTTARWRIVDPLQYYESITTLEQGYGKLDDVIDSAVRTVISGNPLREAVRASNYINSEEQSALAAKASEQGQIEGFANQTFTAAEYESIEKGRRVLSDEMLRLASPLMPQFGIQLVDIVIRQIRYSDDLTKSVYDRMIKERNQIAQAYRSYGEGQKAEWLGKLENERKSILSGAYRSAEEIKGKADAEATQIYTGAYRQDPEFFRFWRSIESYKQVLPQFNKTLSTDMDYFRYLYSPSGR